MAHVQVQLRWSDMDAQGHVNNARIADYLQESRVHIFKDSGLLEHGVVVAGQQVQYKKSIDYDTQPIDVEIVVTKLGGSLVQVGYVLRQHDEVVAEARTDLAAFDFQRQAPVRLTDGMRAALEPHRAEWEFFSELTAPALDGRGTRTLHHPRWTDLDRYGHVNNMLVFEYLQQARIEASPQWDPSMARTGGGDAEYFWLVARQDVDYVAQIDHSFEPLVVHTAPVKLGRTSITSAAEITAPTGELLARGRTIVVCADRDFKPVALPNRDRLEGLVIA